MAVCKYSLPILGGELDFCDLFNADGKKKWYDASEANEMHGSYRFISLRRGQPVNEPVSFVSCSSFKVFRDVLLSLVSLFSQIIASSEGLQTLLRARKFVCFLHCYGERKRKGGGRERERDSVAYCSVLY